PPPGTPPPAPAVGPPPRQAAGQQRSTGTIVAAVVGVLVLVAAVVGLVVVLTGGDDDGGVATGDDGSGSDGSDDGGGTDGDSSDGGDGGSDGGTTDGSDTTDGGGTDNGDDGTRDDTELLTAATTKLAPSTVKIEMMGCRRGTVATGLLLGEDLAVTSAANVQLVWAMRVLLPGEDQPARARPVAVDGDLMYIRLEGGAGTALGITQGSASVGDRVVAVGRTSVTDGQVFPVQGSITGTDGEVVVVTLDSDIDITLLGAPVVVSGPSRLGVITSLEGRTARVTPIGDVPALGNVGLAECGDTTAGFGPSGEIEYQSDGIAALMQMQLLASALAEDDWDLVRSIEPEKSGNTDANFIAGYGALVQSTVVPDTFLTTTNPFRARIALVALETENGAPVTKVFCVTWVADIESGLLVQTGDNSDLLTTPALPGHVDPATQVPRVLQNC
ncbi:MAG: hypothetical protein KDB21_09615, partial [Acidimicrobiales bacterium]|nr:hypothetical protein [Acidimicrobiales bacterium]